MKQEPVFLDTDVILDLLLERDPYFEPAVSLFLKIQNQQVSAFTSPVVIANLFYILNRHLGRKAAVQSLMKLKTLVTVIDCGERVIMQALSSDFKDFEDAIQYYTALEGGVLTLITRNVKDYKTAALAIMTPLEYISSRTENTP